MAKQKRLARAVLEVNPGGPPGKRWVVTQPVFDLEGVDVVSHAETKFALKSAAIAYARTRARSIYAGGRPSQVLIKGRDGKIQTEHTYGDDPRRTPG